jgi:hypothetical protein
MSDLGALRAEVDRCRALLKRRRALGRVAGPREAAETDKSAAGAADRGAVPPGERSEFGVWHSPGAGAAPAEALELSDRLELGPGAGARVPDGAVGADPARPLTRDAHRPPHGGGADDDEDDDGDDRADEDDDDDPDDDDMSASDEGGGDGAIQREMLRVVSVMEMLMSEKERAGGAKNRHRRRNLQKEIHALEQQLVKLEEAAERRKRAAAAEGPGAEGPGAEGPRRGAGRISNFQNFARPAARSLGGATPSTVRAGPGRNSKFAPPPARSPGDRATASEEDAQPSRPDAARSSDDGSGVSTESDEGRSDADEGSGSGEERGDDPGRASASDEAAQRRNRKRFERPDGQRERYTGRHSTW